MKAVRMLTLVGVTALLGSSGCCTLIGLGVGAAVDQSKPSGEVPREEWAALPPDARIDIREVDGCTTQGRFVGMELVRPDSATVAVRTRSGETTVPEERIASISRPRPNQGKFGGLIVGFALDCVITVVAVQAIENLAWSSGSWSYTAP
jgi:hypothetical protein